jgi:hypothetical protein
MPHALAICFVCIVFPSLGILQHYIKFDICTIATLEKLFGVGSFSNLISHLTHHHAILPTSSSGLGHLSMV